MKTVKTSESASIENAINHLWPNDEKAANDYQEFRTREDIISIAMKEFGLSFKVVNTIFLSPASRIKGIKPDRRAYFGKPAYVVSAETVTQPNTSFKLAVPATPTPPPAATSTVSQKSPPTVSSNHDDCYIPPIDPNFVKWGDYDKVLKIVASKTFFPLYISGMSGNGKTVMVEQACANQRREYIRVQISPETDEDDLIGGFRLLNGETVFAKGPVVRAMEEGCILLIDEIDRGSMKIMCLQGVLEGKPIRIKKTGEVITPKSGFNIIATANTKGKGSVDGKYAAANIIDEALLERFAASIEQTYASDAIERKIIIKHMEKFNSIDEDFASKLVAWSAVIRRTFANDAIDDVISTRRLCHIVQSFALFGDRVSAIDLAVSKFDVTTKNAFLDLYSKIDQTVAEVDTVSVTTTPPFETPF